MKKVIKNTVFIMLCMLLHTLENKLNSQPQPEFICGTCKEHAEQSMLSSQNNSLSKVTTPFGGDRNRIPTTGVFKILIVFAQFYNETGDVGGWGYNDTLPYFASTIIDSVVRPAYTNYPPFSVSSFFKEMSNGNFNVIGKVYPRVITTNYPQSYYHNFYTNSGHDFYKNGFVNLEVLKKVDSLDRLYNNINFTEFDNWSRTPYPNQTFLDNYTIQNTTDGQIDLVVIIYRCKSTDLFSEFTGIACLSELRTSTTHTELTKSANFSEYITNEGVKIGGVYHDALEPKENNRYYKSGGITVKYLGASLRALTNVIVHEIGHYLGGTEHSYGYGFGSGASMGGAGSLYAACMSSIEKKSIRLFKFY